MPSGPRGCAGGTRVTTGTTSTRSPSWPATSDPVGALDQTRTEHSDLYSFDEEFERVEAERTGAPGPALADLRRSDLEVEPAPVRTRDRGRRPSSRDPGPDREPTGPTAVSLPRGGPPGGPGRRRPGQPGRRSGSAWSVLLIIAYAIGPKALVVLSAAVVVAAAAEAYGMLQRSGFRPATLLGLVATVGLVFGAYWKGLEALPLAVVLVFAGTHDVVPAAASSRPGRSPTWP